MSDVMLIGVLRMPPDLWRDDALDVSQRHSRYIEAADRIESDAAQIESLQRENEELRRETDEWHEASKDDYKTIRRLEEELDLARAAAITPEMRERIKLKLDAMQRESPLPIGGDLVDLLRDLLGEQG